MTAKQVFDAILIEIDKTGAPTLLLEDFNYLFNKSISRYINKRYNIYDTSQQTTDDLRVLKATSVLPCVLASDKYGPDSGLDSLYGAVYEVMLPNDYLHMLNCVCIYKVNKTYKCYNAGDKMQFGAKRLTSDMWSQIINNFYFRPSYKNPYYYIHNVNINVDNPTNPLSVSNPYGTDIISATTNAATNATTVVGGLPKTIKIGANDVTSVEREAEIRFGNVSSVRMEIRYGKDNTLFELDKVLVDYLKAPQTIRFTQEQFDLVEDTSQVLEWPDYVCQEIINELVMILLENASNPRLQSFIPVSQSIANPAQQEAPQQQRK